MKILKYEIRNLYRRLWFANIFYKISFKLYRRINHRYYVQEVGKILNKSQFDGECLVYYNQIREDYPALRNVNNKSVKISGKKYKRELGQIIQITKIIKKDIGQYKIGLIQFKEAEEICKAIREKKPFDFIDLRRDLNKLVKIYGKGTHLQTKMKKIKRIKIKKNKFVSSANVKILCTFIQECIQHIPSPLAEEN